ncbi:MAG: alpha/beta hydrolase [Planctomycetota bacterium]
MPDDRHRALIATLSALSLAAALPGQDRREPPEPPMRRLYDLRYAEVDGVDARFHSLDLYVPERAQRCPLVVMLHGGAWALGDKRSLGVSERKARRLVAEGFALASVNYRLSPAVRHPAHVEDVARALAWLHDNAARYGLDRDRIFVMGHSAGAHLAALVATDPRWLAAAGKDLTIIKGVVPLDSAAYDLPRLFADYVGGSGREPLYRLPFGDREEGWKDASPIEHVARDRGIAPFLIFHTGLRRDAKAISEAFAARLREAGVAATTVHAVPYDHAAINRELGLVGDAVTRQVLVFLRRRLQELDRAAPGQGGAASRPAAPEDRPTRR